MQGQTLTAAELIAPYVLTTSSELKERDRGGTREPRHGVEPGKCSQEESESVRFRRQKYMSELLMDRQHVFMKYILGLKRQQFQGACFYMEGKYIATSNQQR